MNSPVSFLTNLRQDRLQRSEMFSWNKIINGLKRSRGIIDPFTTFNHRVENVIKQLVHTSAVRSSRYEALGKFGEHERCVRVARGVAESNSSFLSEPIVNYHALALRKQHNLQKVVFCEDRFAKISVLYARFTYKMMSSVFGMGQSTNSIAWKLAKCAKLILVFTHNEP